MSTGTLTSLDSSHATSIAQRADELVSPFFQAVNADEQVKACTRSSNLWCEEIR